MSKSKIYEISYKNDDGEILKLWVDAPNKRIAKWCGANLFNHQYIVFLTAKM